MTIFDNLNRICDNQGLVKGAELCLNPYFFGWLEKWIGWLQKYSLHVKNKSQDFWNKISLLCKTIKQPVNHCIDMVDLMTWMTGSFDDQVDQKSTSHITSEHQHHDHHWPSQTVVVIHIDFNDFLHNISKLYSKKTFSVSILIK